jgi:hypothetical protein
LGDALYQQVAGVRVAASPGQRLPAGWQADVSGGWTRTQYPTARNFDAQRVDVRGTLAYAVAAGRAIISTPYLHARFLLGGNRGLLVDFANADAISAAALRVLDAPEMQAHLESRARSFGQRLLWTEVGARYRSLLAQVSSQRSRLEQRVPGTRTIPVARLPVAPAPVLGAAR